MLGILQGKAEDFEYRDGQLWLRPDPCRKCAHMHETPVMVQDGAEFKYVLSCKNIFTCERCDYGCS